MINTPLECCIDQNNLEVNGRSCLKSYLRITKLQHISKSTLENVLLIPELPLKYPLNFLI